MHVEDTIFLNMKTPSLTRIAERWGESSVPRERHLTKIYSAANAPWPLQYGMAGYEKHLYEWMSKNLVTEDQVARIKSYESQKPSAAVNSFIILGVVVIGIGLISMIAANWKDIPDIIKLGLDFGLLACGGWAAFHSLKLDRPLLLESSLTFLLLFTLASIGLVAQIFHLSGPFHQALLLSSAITFGVMLVSQKYFVPALWACGFFGGLILMSLESGWFRIFFGREPSYVLIAIPFLSALFAAICRSLSGDSGHTQAFRFWVIAAGLLGIVFAEGSPHKVLLLSGMIPAFVLAASTMVCVCLSAGYTRLQKHTLLVVTILFFVQFLVGLPGIQGKIFQASNTIVILAAMGLFFASIQDRKMFQLFVVLIGLRFLVLYFQALGGLAATGLGLIVSGIFIIGVVMLWNKRRKALASWVEGLIK